MTILIPFNAVHLNGKEQGYLAEALANAKLSGNVHSRGVVMRSSSL